MLHILLGCQVGGWAKSTMLRVERGLTQPKFDSLHFHRDRFISIASALNYLYLFSRYSKEVGLSFKEIWHLHHLWANTVVMTYPKFLSRTQWRWCSSSFPPTTLSPNVASIWAFMPFHHNLVILSACTLACIYYSVLAVSPRHACG